MKILQDKIDEMNRETQDMQTELSNVTRDQEDGRNTECFEVYKNMQLTAINANINTIDFLENLLLDLNK